MKTFNINTTNDSKRNKTRVVVLLVLLVLSSMGVFGQEKTTDTLKVDFNAAINITENQVADQSEQQIANIESQIDFVGWFMGSNQNQNTGLDYVNFKSTTSTKKHIISSGVTPNKVLYRTFVKKVMNKDVAIA